MSRRHELLRQYIREALGAGIGRVYTDRIGLGSGSEDEEAPRPQPEDGSEPSQIENEPPGYTGRSALVKANTLT
jgi:hypothetical protein